MVIGTAAHAFSTLLAIVVMSICATSTIGIGGNAARLQKSSVQIGIFAMT
jgi:hypothetical protein